MQDGRTPLMVAADAGQLQVAKLLLEIHQSNVNEEDSKVSEPVMGRVSKHSSCVIVPTCDQVMQELEHKGLNKESYRSMQNCQDQVFTYIHTCIHT